MESVTGLGETHRDPKLTAHGGEGDQHFFFVKHEPALKSCQALDQRLEIVRGLGGILREGDPEDIVEAQRSKSAGEGMNCRKAGGWEAQA